MCLVFTETIFDLILKLAAHSQISADLSKGILYREVGFYRLGLLQTKEEEFRIS